MPIDLSLTRISTLLKHLPNPLPWKYIHVSGTNGKGSICAYLSSSLVASQLRTGRFTSPHLINRWDCITLNDKPVSRLAFEDAERVVKSRDQEAKLGCTEFEILTATAFEIFTRERVDVAVVEVGVGGREDATNALEEKPLCAVVSSIGRDHAKLLGSEFLPDIARVKAGIAKEGVQVVVNAANDHEIVDVIKDEALKRGASEVVVAKPGRSWGPGEVMVQTAGLGQVNVKTPLLGEYQSGNVSAAVYALSIAAKTFPKITARSVQEGVGNTRWPGRLDIVDLGKTFLGKEKMVLMDGAHNLQAAVELKKYVDKKLRPESPNGSIAWIITTTKERDFVNDILYALIDEDEGMNDVVAGMEFGPVAGMPWVESKSGTDIAFESAIMFRRKDSAKPFGRDIGAALKWIDETHPNIPVVVCGSLYLIGDIYRAIAEKKGNDES